jgi:hypothetical protein
MYHELTCQIECSFLELICEVDVSRSVLVRFNMSKPTLFVLTAVGE